MVHLHVVGGRDPEDLRVDDEARPGPGHLHVVLVTDLNTKIELLRLFYG